MTARNRRQIDRNCAAVLFCFHKNVKKTQFRRFFQVGFSVRVSLSGRGPGPIWARAHMGLGPYGPWPIWAWPIWALANIFVLLNILLLVFIENPVFFRIFLYINSRSTAPGGHYVKTPYFFDGPSGEQRVGSNLSPLYFSI